MKNHKTKEKIFHFCCIPTLNSSRPATLSCLVKLFSCHIYEVV